MRLAGSTSSISNTATNTTTTQSCQLTKAGLFIWVNVIVMIMVGTAMVFNGDVARIGNGVYIIVLAMICTSPLLVMKSYRGKHFIMMVFLAYYFASFALKDMADLLLGNNSVAHSYGSEFMSGGEIAILVGAMIFISGYMLVSEMFTGRATKEVFVRDWSENSRVVLGLTFWAIGYFITLRWQLGVADVFSNDNKLSNSFTGVIIHFRILQPLGVIILIYHYLVVKSRFTLVVIAIVMASDFVLGFIGDSKELAVRDLLFYLVSVVLLRERIPFYQTIVFVFIAAITFSVFGAYRLAVHAKHESRVEAINNIDKHIGSISREDGSISDRLSYGMEYFSDRINLKTSVEMIIARTDKDIAFQNGRTIEPLLYIFIPRFIWPDKPNSSMAGQVFNQEFKISASKRTFISTSQVGELYWNFGWSGIVVGMALIGGVMGAIALLMRLDINATLPRFLFILMTVYLLCLRSETAISEVFSVWGRTALLLILLNAFIPKIRGFVDCGKQRSPVIVSSDVCLIRNK